ncbi:MAG TPA: acyl-CoA thioesterase/bile acid-CoA:amino acid N-acyltransferase family protein, partial [Acidimicrobiales bacterium]|nr:acyl-CoA thioesterase/bile acid-CoA:amino acid N-acyltransferase family protein [Acidimicrobiales bacterium]
WLGRAWASQATFVAGDDGTVDLRKAKPVGGSYSGADPNGLFASMRPTTRPHPGQDTMDIVDVTVRDAGRQTHVELTRWLETYQVSSRYLVAATDGMNGVFYSPRPKATRAPGVVVFGGSEGGLSTPVALSAQLLASHGVPALAIAYFHDRGLPPALHNIPLEYFANAARWLAAQPGVDPARVFLMGSSAGSEAALLTAAYYPDLIYGAVGLSPGDTATACHDPSGPCSGSAWSWHGQPLAYDDPGGFPVFNNDPAAIPAERIRGPIFLLCGEADLIWDSCGHARSIAGRLARFGRPQPALNAYWAAGHGIDIVPPDLPGGDLPETKGLQPDSNQLAREDAWPKLLRFLGAPLMNPKLPPA